MSGFCLGVVQGAAVEQDIALLALRLLFARRQGCGGNPGSLDFPSRIGFIQTALTFDGAISPGESGAAACRVVVGKLSQSGHGDARGSDYEKRSYHCGPLFRRKVLAGGISRKLIAYCSRASKKTGIARCRIKSLALHARNGFLVASSR